MLDDSRPHAVRSCARRLAKLAEMPRRSWRLHQVARDRQVHRRLPALKPAQDA